MNKFLFIKLPIILIVIAIPAMLLTYLSMDSGYVYCVTVKNEADFNGQFLKTENTTSKATILEAECVKLDNELDKSNGNKIGVVRWANCSNGPDCNETGNF
jgi:hypothetical protein